MEYKPKSREEIQRNMSAIRSRDNQTEVALRRALFALGLRFRLHSSTLMGKPDIVFPRAKVAVFIDGDYWHARQMREKGIKVVRETLRTLNKDYWLQKFTRRVARDDEVTEHLHANGWLVLRYWESDVKREVGETAARVKQLVRKRERAFERRMTRKKP